MTSGGSHDSYVVCVTYAREGEDAHEQRHFQKFWRQVLQANQIGHYSTESRSARLGRSIHKYDKKAHSKPSNKTVFQAERRAL